VVWGLGLAQTLTSCTRSGVPMGLALVVIGTEFLGPLGLTVAVLTWVVALGLICEMLGAIVRVHWRHSFLMHWTGIQPGEASILSGSLFARRWSFQMQAVNMSTNASSLAHPLR